MYKQWKPVAIVSCTIVPYFRCGTNEQAPTVVYCYGAFAENQLPHNLPIIGKLWFEKGLSFMIANIRGGAEFGPQWHQAALRGKNIKVWKESRGSGATIMATRVK